jgi:hypothetical protein
MNTLRDFQNYARGRLSPDNKTWTAEQVEFLSGINYRALNLFEHYPLEELPDIDEATPLSEAEWDALSDKLDGLIS